MSPSAPELHRITTAYVDKEDRLRLSGETATGTTLVLWLTQRLANRLVHHLGQWLNAHSSRSDRPTLAHDWAQQFAQQSAAQALPRQAAVPHHNASAERLVHSVDIGTGPDGVTLTFKTESAAAPCATLALAVVPLRQWLGIVQAQYLAADWPLSVWPHWMATDGPDQPAPVLH